jgi:inner membrane protein
MDPLSHLLLGAASGHGASSRYGRVAAVAGAAAAMLPDADVLIGSGADPLLAVEFHRHFTHALVTAPVAGLIAAAIVWFALRRRVPFTALYLPAIAGFASAILLDACTSYGTRLWWPVSEARVAWSIVAVVDPVVTLVLITGVVLALKADARLRARITVACVLAYLALGALQHQRAADLAREIARSRGHAIGQLEVKPTLANLLLWRSIYSTNGQFYVDALRLGVWDASVVYRGGEAERITPAELVPPLTHGSVQLKDVERFSRLSEGFLVRHPDRATLIGDVRYAMLPDSVRPLWGVEIDPAEPQRHVAFVTLREFTARDRQRFLAMLRGVAPGTLPR